MRVDSSSKRIRQVAASLGIESLLRPEVLRNTRITTYEPGETVMFSGDPVTEVSVLFEGIMQICSVSENGKLVTVAVSRPPQMFGDIEFLQGHSTLHSVVAKTKASLLSFAWEDVQLYLAEDVVFYRMICNNLITKLYDTSYNYPNLLQHSTKTLLAQRLAQNCDAEGLVLCKCKELAEYLGVTPRHISRLITELEQEGAVMREGSRRIRICSWEKLLEFTENSSDA